MLHTSSENHLLVLAGLLFVIFVWLVPVAPAQEQSPTPTPAASPTPATPQQAAEPLYTDYRGVSVGMSVAEAREKLGAPKSKGKQQDFFVFSKTESAQVVYLDGKVRTVSVDYVGADSGAPTPMEVLGVEITPRKNGTIYKLVRYPDAGYWVAYSRTAGKKPIVSVTMRKIRAPNR
ncbi:MAG: hypothetical protein M3447_00280 [Acidobacteriota bacterium]|nr:hypothetical protein [Acidobacteriota bacterium]